MANSSLDNIDLFGDKDMLDVAVESYEQNVPLAAQIGIGFTPAGIGIDVAEATKYGRDAYRQAMQGNLGQAGISAGIATLSTLGIIPLLGDLIKSGGKPALKGLAKSIETDTATDLVPINKLKFDASSKGSGRGKDAKNQAQSVIEGTSYKGVTADKRQPIEVLQNPDGSLTVLGGNTTTRILREEGVPDVPVTIFKTKEDFDIYDQVRKRDKIALREQKASMLVPQIGSPSLEELIRRVGGSSLEKSVAKQFNNQAHNFRSVDEMFDTAREINTGFQKSIGDIASSMNLKTLGNPGETNLAKGVKELKIDPATGHFAGEVKKMPRMIEKANTKYGGDVNQITDSIRTRILAETTEEADEVAKRIADRFPTIDSGNQVNALGLRDRKLNILYKDPQSGKTLIAEIGITPSSMHIAAEQSHKYYEPYRKFLEKYKGQDVPLEVREQMINQENMMRYLFRKAETDIHPSWLSDDIAKKPGVVKTPDYAREGVEYVEKFSTGGQVVGRAGKSSPMMPNSDSKSGLESLAPLREMSAYTGPSPFRQFSSSAPIKNTSSTPRSTLGAKTAGSPSQEKYKLSYSIDNSITKKYDNASIDEPLEGGRKELI